jgi:hypothetical protein
MKKSFIFTILLTLGLFATSLVQAQSHTSIQYSVGVPMGELKDHAGNISGRGFVFEYHKTVNDNLSMGINLGYNLFYEEKSYGSYTSGTATLSGIQYCYDNMFPMLFNTQYHLGTGPFRPYGGLGIGTLYNLRNTDMGLYTIEENNWHFLMTPEVGFTYDLGQGVGIKFNAKYDNAFKSADADAMGNLSFNIGLNFVVL